MALKKEHDRCPRTKQSRANALTTAQKKQQIIPLGSTWLAVHSSLPPSPMPGCCSSSCWRQLRRWLPLSSSNSRSSNGMQHKWKTSSSIYDLEGECAQVYNKDMEASEIAGAVQSAAAAPDELMLLPFGIEDQS